MIEFSDSQKERILKECKYNVIKDQIELVKKIDNMFLNHNDPQFMLDKYRAAMVELLKITEGKRDKEFLNSIEAAPF